MSNRKKYFTLYFFIIPFLFTYSVCFAQIDSNAVGNESIEYSSSAAGEVILIWGINDWKTFKEKTFLPGQLLKMEQCRL